MEPRAPALQPPPALPDAPAYFVDTKASEVRVHVRRDGPLAAFGHDHLLIAPVSGKVHAGNTAAGSGFDLAIDVQAFEVDPPNYTKVDEQARRGTRENLLGPKVLDAEKYPRIVLRAVSLAGPRWNPDVVAQLTLHGVTREIAFPAAVFMQDDALLVIARFTVRQSAFGIEPFSVFGGGLRVQDAVDVQVRILARRAKE